MLSCTPNNGIQNVSWEVIKANHPKKRTEEINRCVWAHFTIPLSVCRLSNLFVKLSPGKEFRPHKGACYNNMQFNLKLRRKKRSEGLFRFIPPNVHRRTMLISLFQQIVSKFINGRNQEIQKFWNVETPTPWLHHKNEYTSTDHDDNTFHVNLLGPVLL